MHTIDTTQLPEPVAAWLRGETIRLNVVDNRLMRLAELDRAEGHAQQAIEHLRLATRPG